jgi:excisionase family DNA binding protein
MTEMNVGSPTGGKLLSTTEAAAYTGLSDQTLANYRSSGRGPAYFKVGRYARYDEHDLRAWMRSRRFTSTSQESVA